MSQAQTTETRDTISHRNEKHSAEVKVSTKQKENFAKLLSKE
jgi:hypothetical protein